jgi:hypothetical protein
MNFLSPKSTKRDIKYLKKVPDRGLEIWYSIQPRSRGRREAEAGESGPNLENDTEKRNAQEGRGRAEMSGETAKIPKS